MAKETINKMKRQPMEWDKIFMNDLTDKRLISKISKLVQKLWETWRFLKETKKQCFYEHMGACIFQISFHLFQIRPRSGIGGSYGSSVF